MTVEQNVFYKLFSSEVFVDIFKDINDFTQRLLKNYLDFIQNHDLKNNEKEIYDAIWGSIELNSAEMILIDSPLLQRLKKIRQLGLSDFVYPGSTYSRFYHTLGVVSLSSRMTDVVNRKNISMANEGKAMMSQLIRYAAIFHDVGHMIYSHAGEQFFSEDKNALLFSDASKMLDEFLIKTGYEPALHELLSCMIVNTQAVKEMLQISFKYVENKYLRDVSLLEQHVEYITCLITGVPVDKQILPYSKIINGLIDADKCDYLTRDSYVTNVPVAVDVSRLIQKLRLIEVKKINLPEVWHDDFPNKPYLELAVKDSAEKTLFQLCMARNTMYGSVYFHQKVLTAETSFRDILSLFQELFPKWFSKFSQVLNLSDDLLGYVTIDMLTSSAQAEKDEHRKKKLITLAEKINALHNRTLCKRVLNFKKSCLTGINLKVDIFWNQIIMAIDAKRRDSLLKSIRDEYVCLFKKLNNREPAGADIFLVCQPMAVYDHTKIKVRIDLGNNQHRDYRGYAYLESKESNDKEFLLVTDQYDRDIVMLAAEKILFEKYGIMLTDESFACSKYSVKEIDKSRKRLYEIGYYDGCSYPLISNRLLYDYHISQDDIEEIVNLCAIYEGENGYKVTAHEIENFFKQFMGCIESKDRTTEILRGITNLLLNAIYVSRRMFVEAFSQILMENASIGYNVYTIGSNQDSSVHFSYFLNDIRNKVSDVVIIDDLSQWLAASNEKDHIIFFDDGSYSGSQILSVFQEYMGIPSGNRATNESHVFELADDLKDKLRNVHITMFFICFNNENMDNLKNEFGELGLHDVDICFAHEMDHVLFNRQPSAVKEILKKIGLSLITSAKSGNPNWDATRIQNAALGYNDARQMVILKSSIPTYTITAFWAKGRLDNGMEWKPLFLRTSK